MYRKGKDIRKKDKVWWHAATLFFFISYYIHSYTHTFNSLRRIGWASPYWYIKLYLCGNNWTAPSCFCVCSFWFWGEVSNSWILNDIGRNSLLGNRKKIAKFLMRTFTCCSTFLYDFGTLYMYVLCAWKDKMFPWFSAWEQITPTLGFLTTACEDLNSLRNKTELPFRLGCLFKGTVLRDFDFRYFYEYSSLAPFQCFKKICERNLSKQIYKCKLLPVTNRSK